MLPVNTNEIITGTLVINEVIYGVEGQPCAGENGYNDIHGGTQIVVKDNTGTIIATGALEQGKGVKPDMNAELLKLHEQIGTESGRGTPLECKFAVTIENVPKSNFYMIEIGRRRAMTYKAEELQQNNWKLELSLG